jgi:hypothetical protein
MDLDLLYETGTGDAIWICSYQKLQTNLSKTIRKRLLLKLSDLFEKCFGKDEEENIDNFITENNVLCVYIKDYVKKMSISKLISSIVSIVIIEINNTQTVTLYNVCNDLTIKGGYMRQLLHFIKLILSVSTFTQLLLFVEYSNPFFKKAVELYKEKGFKKIDSNNDMITMECKL